MDRHQNEKSDPDQDRHQNDAYTEHWIAGCLLYERKKGKKSVKREWKPVLRIPILVRIRIRPS
jgi:hypothetical protein